jgi:hypothetical protein
MVSKMSEEGEYAIKFLDNGGRFDTFSKRHKKLHAAIKKESSRRMMVRIRYAMNKSPQFRNDVYKKIKKRKGEKLEPNELYKSLEILPYKILNNINKSVSQDSK